MGTTGTLVMSSMVTIAAIAGYHALAAGDSSATPTASTLVRVPDLTDLEERVAALERRAPATLRGMPADDLASRLARLERALGEGRPVPVAPETTSAVARVSELEVIPEDPAEGPAPADGAASLTARQEQRVRDLATEILSAREQRRAAGMVTGVAERLGISLTPAQRDAVEKAYAAHRDVVRSTIDSARAEGLTREQTRPRLDTLQTELRDQLAETVPASDAEALAAELSRPPERPPGGGGGPPR